MTKITRFQDVPQFTREGGWECDFAPKGMLEFLDEHAEKYGFNLDPDFQRVHVWTEAQQVAYIEFFLRGGKTGRVIYFNDPNWQVGGRNKPGAYNDAVLVDGKQRVQAWRRFFNNEIQVFGSYYREFTDNLRMMSQTMKVNVNNLKSRAEVLQWYIDFNAGGTLHSDEEIAKVRALLAKERS